MQDFEIVAEFLALGKDWHVSSIEFDQASNRVDIKIEAGVYKKPSLFARRKQQNVDTVTLRHLPFGGVRTYLSVPKLDVAGKPNTWGAGNSKFTYQMENLLLEALKNTQSNKVVANLFGLHQAEVREVVNRSGIQLANVTDALENVMTGSAQPAVESVTVVGEVANSFDIIGGSEVPKETHEKWQRLIDQEVALDTNSVGLQMLLERARRLVAENPTEIVRINAAKLLRQYFVKNKSHHQHELDTIFGFDANITRITPEFQESSRIEIVAIEDDDISSIDDISTMEDVEDMTEVPDVEHPCWNKLLSGELSIMTNVVGMQLILQQVVRSTQKEQSPENKLGAIKMLRQYFLKYKNKHKNEIAQLYNKKLPVEHYDQVVTKQVEQVIHQDKQTLVEKIPPEYHDNWQRLINGDIKIQTDIVALKMMVERVKIAIENNPDSATKLAGAKILRQYFIKHRVKHQAEIEHLRIA